MNLKLLQSTRTLSLLAVAGTIALAVTLMINSPASVAHNNPEFREDLLNSIAVPAGNASRSESFAIEWPDKTVQLIWRIASIDGDAAGSKQSDLKFSLLKNGENQATELTTGSATNRFKGEGFTIQTIGSAKNGYIVELYAKVLDRSKKKQ